MLSPVIRLMTADDIPAALELCHAAGWNQLADDWLRLIGYQPQGCFVAELDDRIVGTVTTTSYQTRLAWIGMMLVDLQMRRRGIATALMSGCLDHLWRGGARCIKLDATAEGFPLYSKLGFRPEWSFHRWQREHHWAKPTQHSRSRLNLNDFASLDREAFGADRSDWLALMQQGNETRCLEHPGGFGMSRPGHLADYLGPVTAADAAAAEAIVGGLLSQTSGKVFWDLPAPNSDAVELAKRLGFAPVRDLTRMVWGEPNSPNLRLQFALSDPGSG